jgi:hypothetical protein
MRFVPLDAELLRAMPRPAQCDGTIAWPPLDDPSLAAAYCRLSEGWLLFDRSQIVGAIGVMPMEYPFPVAAAPRGMAWFMRSIFLRPRHSAQARTFLSAWFAELLTRGCFRRIEATAVADMKGHCRYLERLGMGEAHHLYAKVRA